MTVPRPFLLAILSVTTTVGLLLVGAPTASAATAATVSPSGCIQRADYPHKSTHVPGTMNGVVRTVCHVYVRRISESAQMWESRWWGWDRIGIKGFVSDIDSKALSANASDKCRKNTVRVTGSGSVLDVDGRTYYATTESIHAKNPCHL
jgi:hypothetical protein